MARPPNVPTWSVGLEYEPYGFYSRQCNVTITLEELMHYELASRGDYYNWANQVLIRQAQTWTKMGGRRPHLVGPTHYLRFTTIRMAWSLYQQTAEKFGYQRASHWVRAALNNEVGL